VEAPAVRAAALRVNAAVAPTAAFSINSRRESIVHSFRQNERIELLGDGDGHRCEDRERVGREARLAFSRA
jgi:hypothetical protein